MTIHLVGGTVAHLVALLGARAELTLPTSRYAHLLAQVALSETYAVLPTPDTDCPLAMAGIAPLPNGAGEIWFGVHPDGLGRHLVSVLRATRLVLHARRAAYPGGMMCLVRDGHRPGERLARQIGCVPQGVLLGDHREWTWAS